MVSYYDDYKHATYNGYVFTRDDKTGYFLSTVKIGERRKRLHVYVLENETGVIVPRGCQVHHIDGNKNNNEIDNLRLLSEHRHLSYHSRKNAKEHPEQIEHSLELAREAAKAWHGSEAGKEWHKAHYEKMSAKLNATKEFECEYCGKKFVSRKCDARFCCNSHKTAWRFRAGLDNELRKCAICGKSFVTNKYSKKKTCSKNCGHVLKGMSRRGIHYDG